jgi:hypothetical protein
MLELKDKLEEMVDLLTGGDQERPVQRVAVPLLFAELTFIDDHWNMASCRLPPKRLKELRDSLLPAKTCLMFLSP